MPSPAAKLLTAPLLTVVAAAAIATLAGCKQDQAPVPSASASAASEAAVDDTVPAETPTGDASQTASGIASDLDTGALQEKRDPERLLRFYINAIRVGDWQSAARAWSLDATMTPEKLEAEFGGAAGPKIALGRGDVATAAGSSFYEAPVTIDFADGRESRRGTIVLRRANDVPGASELQLVWRIDRSSLLSQ